MPWKTYRGRVQLETPSWILDPQGLAQDGRRTMATTKLVRFSGIDFWSQHLRSMEPLGEGITYTPASGMMRASPLGPSWPRSTISTQLHLELTSDGRWWVPDPDATDPESDYPGWSEIDSRELLVTRYIVRPGKVRGLGVLQAHAADLGFAAHVRGFADNLLRRGVPNGWLKSSKPDLTQAAGG